MDKTGANDDIISALLNRFGAQSMLTGDAVSARSSGYLDSSPLRARALLRPASTEETAEMLHLCSAHGQAVVPHGGLTNLVYSTLAKETEVALSLERMNVIEEIDVVGGTITLQAGVTLRTLQETAAQHGLFFPLDLAARDTATVGGLIAANAGGARVIRYGMMRDLALGLEAVLADGVVLSSMNKMLKNNAGYDLKHLLIGSEGTLGVITRAVLRLYPAQPSASTALLGLDTFEQVTRLLALSQRMLGGQLSSYEVMWNAYYRLTTTPPAPATAPLKQDYPLYVLLESLGDDSQEDQARFERLLETAADQGLFEDAVLARSSAQREKIWKVREDSDQIEAQYKPTFGFDVSLPIPAMEGYVREIETRLRQEFGEIQFWVYGHVGDGNLHLNLWGAHIDEAQRDLLSEIIYSPLQALGGSISAEHGIGLEKKAYLHYSRTPEEIALMRRIKNALDPQGILNPGKVFDLI